MRPRPGLAVLSAALLSLATPLPARAQLGKVETPDLRLVYVDGALSYLVPYAGRTFTNSLAFHRKLFDFTPSERPTVLMLDFQDYGNAFATSVPRNMVQVHVAPLSYLFETLSANERLTMIANHELVHVATMDQPAGADRMWRKLFFGKPMPIAEQPESVPYFFLTSPRVAVPRWYAEGIAVFVDTWMAGGLGRAQSGYDEMVFRAMVSDGARFYDPLGLAAEGTKIDFQVEVNSYLYGARFMTWLAYEYAPEKVIDWTARRPGSRAHYARQFAHVFGTPLDAAWARWVAFENTFQQANLAEIRKFPVTPAADVSRRALGSISRAHLDRATGTLYAALNYPGIVAHIGAIAMDTGEVRHLVDVKGPRIYQVASMAYDATARAIFYTTDNVAYRDLVRLDVATGRRTVLQKDLRVGDLVINRADRSLWGLRHLNGLVSIVKMTPPYTDWTRVVTLPYGVVAYDLDISADGRLAVLGWGDVSGRQSLRVLSVATLADASAPPLAEHDFGTVVPSGFVFSDDGRYLYGSTYLTGVSNIFRFEIATRDLQAVSNAETGFVRPLPLGGDDLLVFRFTGEGFVPSRIKAVVQPDLGAITFLGERTAAKHPIVGQWFAGSPANVDWEGLRKTEGDYRLAGGLTLESLYPIIQGYKDTAAVGLRADFSDPLQFNHASIAVSFSPGGDLPTQERLHARAEYRRYDWTFDATWNQADFYDLFGPTKASRKGYTVGIGRSDTLIYDAPKRLELAVEARYSGNLDQLPQYQNVAVVVDRLFTAKADLSYSNVRSSLGSVDEEKGQKATVSLRSDYVNETAFTKIHATFDLGLALPIGHSSVWLRTAAGASAQAVDEPFANFYFGGFGNNYVDHADEKRYRQFDSLPGQELNAVPGRNFGKAVLEWNLPPVRFSRAGSPDGYLTFMRPALFVSALVTNLDRSDALRREVVGVGGQLDFRFTILSVLDMTLSAGAGVAFERGRPAEREAMVSLRVLR
jgi:hypothetical protein